VTSGQLEAAAAGAELLDVLALDDVDELDDESLELDDFSEVDFSELDDDDDSTLELLDASRLSLR
jgi:hypothetical protein